MLNQVSAEIIAIEPRVGTHPELAVKLFCQSSGLAVVQTVASERFGPALTVDVEAAEAVLMGAEGDSEGLLSAPGAALITEDGVFISFELLEPLPHAIIANAARTRIRTSILQTLFIVVPPQINV